MTKYSHLLGICCALLLGGCQTVEQLSIDYMLPAEVSFPPSLKRVAVVNNMPSIPDNKLIVEETDEKKTFDARRCPYLYLKRDAVGFCGGKPRKDHYPKLDEFPRKPKP